MAYENLCMYCFEDLGGQSTCPHCGRDAHAAVPQIQMLPGTLVYHDRFLIGRALGQDATGIVYAAFDTKREKKLRIREYLPRDCAERLNDGAVVPIAGMEDRFDAGISKLRASVEGVEDPRKRHFFFEENGTAYIAQRKAAAAAASEDAGEEEAPEAHGRRNIIIIAIVAAIVVVAAAIGIISFLGGALPTGKDVTENPTLDPDQVWIPAESPTVTPYVSPTFAALVDPDLSWMDYTYQDDSTQGGGAGTVSGSAATATPRPTAAPTLSGDATGYTGVSGRSSQADIRELQQKLVTLGWLDYSKVTGQYDSATKQAVKDFQTYINQSYNPKPKLTVDGIAGPKTQQWLYQTNAAKPTATPAPTPTPRPAVTAAPSDDTVIDENSGANQIRDMQRKLVTLGVMPEGSDSGRFDATTRAAVKRFQARVNQLQGYEVLETSGKMDALSLAFLDYYVDEWNRLQTATAAPTDAPAETATPTPAPTEAGGDEIPAGTVKADSPKADVRAVQRRLIAIGMLPQGADDGVYGRATASAVSAFQAWVNAQRGEQTLSVSGEADALTIEYLKYCEDNGIYPAATAAPTEAPTEAPTAVPDEDEEPEIPDERIDVTIDRDSDPDSIRRVQEMLVDVGLLPEGSVDSVYGGGTTRAVRAFQEWINQNGGALPVTGIVDNATREMLEFYSDRGMTVTAATETPTEAPAEVPTEAPVDGEPGEGEDEAEEALNISIDPDSPEESIRYVQEMLSEIGALPESEITGIYSDGTAQAVVAFQQWINSQGISSLEVTGQIDNGTRQMLEYCSDHAFRMTVAGGEPTEAPLNDPFGTETAEPVEAVTEAPTPTVNPDDPFDEPDDEEETDNSPFKATVEKLDISIAGEVSGGSVVEVANQSFTVSWAAEGAVASYNVYVSDSAGNSIVYREGIRDTSFKVDASRMNAGEVYTVTVGALPQDGGEDDIVWQSARFTLPAPATPEPTEEPTPEPEPVVGAVEAPAIFVGGAAANGGMTVMEGDSFGVEWSASGDVQSYNVQITDANGNIITSQPATRQTGITVRASMMVPGLTYTITVGALPVNGGESDTVWSTAQFMLAEPATPEPTEAPTPEPTEAPTPEPAVGAVSRPSVTVGGSAYQRDGISYMTDSTIIVSWGAEGDVASYIVYVENQSGERQNLGATTDTSRTVSTGSLPSGVYTVYVGAIPVNGTQDDAQWGTATFGIPAPTPTPTEEPTPVPEMPEQGFGGLGVDDGAANYAEPQPQAQQQNYNFPIDGSSDEDTIRQLQLRLYSIGFMAGEPEPGVLDQVTLSAVAEFQRRANDQNGAGLSVVDPSNPGAVVDVATLRMIAQGLG